MFFFLLSPTICKASALVQLGVAGSKPRRLSQRGRASLAALGPVLVLVIFSVHVLVLILVLVLVLVLSRPEHSSEDFLVQPRLAALRHVAQQTSQRAARPPSAPKNPEKEKQTFKTILEFIVLWLVSLVSECLLLSTSATSVFSLFESFFPIYLHNFSCHFMFLLLNHLSN